MHVAQKRQDAFTLHIAREKFGADPTQYWQHLLNIDPAQ
jgi:hypothetical protein